MYIALKIQQGSTHVEPEEWRCSSKQKFPSIPIVTWIFKEFSATQAIIFNGYSNSKASVSK